MKIGHHTDDVYSKCGRTNDLNKFKNMSLSMYVKVLNIGPRFLFGILILDMICLVYVSLLSTMTPRSFSDSTFSIGISYIVLVLSRSMSGSGHGFLNACAYTF